MLIYYQGFAIFVFYNTSHAQLFGSYASLGFGLCSEREREREREKKFAVNCEVEVLFITLFITSSKRVLILLLVISITHSIVILIINTQTKHKSLHCKYTLSKITLANSAPNTSVCLPTTKGKNDIFYKVSFFPIYKILVNMKVSLIYTI